MARTEFYFSAFVNLQPNIYGSFETDRMGKAPDPFKT